MIKDWEKFNESENTLPKIKSCECLECGEKNKIWFAISTDDEDLEYVDGELVSYIDHKGLIIKDDGDKGKKLKSIEKYDFAFCECHGDCSDQISDSDVKVTLEDGTDIIGMDDIWDYMVKLYQK
jgi:hypothetical protein